MMQNTAQSLPPCHSNRVLPYSDAQFQRSIGTGQTILSPPLQIEKTQIAKKKWGCMGCSWLSRLFGNNNKEAIAKVMLIFSSLAIIHTIPQAL